MSLDQAILEFIHEIENGKYKSVIVQSNDGGYYVVDNGGYDADTIIYTYSMYLNSSANMNVASIGGRLMKFYN